MSSRKISELTELGSIAVDDLFAVVDIDSGETKKATLATILQYLGNAWTYDATPTGTVDGVNKEFVIPESAQQAIIYADGVRLRGGGIDYTHHDGDKISFVEGSQPFNSISADYLI